MIYDDAMFAFVTTSYDEWVKRDFSIFDSVYVGRAPSVYHLSPYNVLDIDDMYPPVCKNLLAWHDVRSKHLNRYTWFVRCDQDTVVHRAQLRRCLTNLSDRSGPTNALYSGRMGEGRPFDRKTNNISFLFAMGGTCEVLNNMALVKLNTQSVVAECRQPPYTQSCPPHCHSDVEIGRLLHNVGISYTRPPDMDNVFHHQYPLTKITTTIQTAGAHFGLLGSYNTDGHFVSTHAIFHPVKNVMLYNIMVQIIRGATPPYAHKHVSCTHVPEFLLWWTSNCDDPDTIRSLKNKSPRCLRDKHSVYKPLCPNIALKYDPLPRAFVAIASVKDSTKYARGLATLLSLEQPPNVVSYHKKLHVHNLPLENLHAGEIAYRFAVLDALERAIAHKKDLLWFDDDVLVRRDFSARWESLMRNNECTGFLRHPGGILLLGASEWTKFTWPPASKVCYSSLPRTCGSFAFLASHSILELIKKFLTSSNRPLDHVYPYIQREGFPVRVLHPNLIIADTRHGSTTNPDRPAVRNRHTIMHWENLSTYMSPLDVVV